MTPQRIQRKRTKGWRMPENTVYVGRPSKWGNPFRVGMPIFNTEWEEVGTIDSAEEAVEKFRRTLMPGEPEEIQAELRGKNLACWCPLNRPCHADVLLELANKDTA